MADSAAQGGQAPATGDEISTGGDDATMLIESNDSADGEHVVLAQKRLWAKCFLAKPLSVVHAEESEGVLERSLGFWDLFALGFGGTVGRYSMPFFSRSDHGTCEKLRPRWGSPRTLPPLWAPVQNLYAGLCVTVMAACALFVHRTDMKSRPTISHVHALGWMRVQI